VRVGIDALTQQTLVALSTFLTDKASQGLVTNVATLKPADLSGPQSLADAMANDRGPARMVAIAVDPSVFSTLPVVIGPEDLTVFTVVSAAGRGTATADQQIAQGAPVTQVLRTDAQGRASTQVTSASPEPLPGEVRIRVQGLGEEKAVTIAVVAPTVSYSTTIQPIFNSRCISCHSLTTFNAGGLDLRSYHGLMAGGNSAAVVVPGAASDSLIVARLQGTVQPQMPLGQTPLSPAQIQSIKDWINQGALNN